MIAPDMLPALFDPTDAEPPVVSGREKISTLFGGSTPPSVLAVISPRADAKIDLRAIELETIPLRTGYAGIDETLAFLGAARAPSTYLIYSRIATNFVRWCAAKNVDPVERPETAVARYVATRAVDGVGSISCQRDAVGLEALYRAIGLGTGVSSHFLVRQTLKGIVAVDARPKHKMRAMIPAYIRAALPYYADMARRDPIRAARDVSLLTLGLATAFRRVELASLDVADVELFEKGMRIVLRKSKTRRPGNPHIVEVHRILNDDAICPVANLLRYAEIARLGEGPLFRGTYPDGSLRATRISDDTVARVVKRTAEALGLDGNWGAHSLRVGTCTAMYEGGATLAQIAKVSDHKSESVLLDYIRSESPFAVDLTSRIFA